MQVPLSIAFEGGLESSEALESKIRREAEKLEQFHNHIISCRVAVIGRSGHRRHGDLYAVRLQITTPAQGDVMIDRNPPVDHSHEDPYVAVRDAFRAARRRLQDHRRRMQGKVKVHQEPPHGRVARLFEDEGYGFIESADGREIYFHRNAVVNGAFDRLTLGAPVRFAEAEGEKGPQASTVHLAGKGGHGLPA